MVVACAVGWNGAMQKARTLAAKIAYRLVLPLFLLAASAWLSLKGLNSLLYGDFVLNFQLYVTMPLQYHLGWGAVVLSPFVALTILHWTVYRTSRRVPFRILATGISLSACLFAVLNWFNALRPITCYDCFFPYGVPLTFYREGGFAGGGGIVWAGLAGDIVVFAAVGVATAWGVASVRSRPRQG